MIAPVTMIRNAVSCIHQNRTLSPTGCEPNLRSWRSILTILREALRVGSMG